MLPLLAVHAWSRAARHLAVRGFANFTFQVLTLLAMYLGLRRCSAPVPFLATAAAIPVFFSLPKTIVYDSMAQFFAALLGLGMLGCARRNAWRSLACEAGIHSRWGDVFSPSLLLMASAAAACLLSKQSTGGGACLGAAAAFLLGSHEPWRRRLGDCCVFAGWTAVLAGIMVLTLSPWIDAGGLVRDVFLTGSEPKGGSLRLLKNLGAFGLVIGEQGLLMGMTLIAALGALGRGNGLLPERDDEHEPHALPGFVLLLPALAALMAFLAFPAAKPLERLFNGCGTVARQVLWSGLLVGLVFSLRRGGARHAAAPLFAVLLGATLFHSLRPRRAPLDLRQQPAHRPCSSPCSEREPSDGWIG